MADVFPSRVQQETFVTRHDIKLQLYCKTSLVPKCIVVLTHGVQSHAAFEWMSYPVQLGGQMRVESGSEKSWLSKLADELPADVWAYDIQGHGRSGGKRGNVRHGVSDEAGKGV
ncbi:MAG: uncharacterized protein KVP18_001841 [Porospora cf. gigantea A]|uniref:uncharacterized protein n=1 Tax=Porospora cf. gigantea A TaxID=2853593 RepID=UPI00355A59E1|nr:MAG: hypothetical protein KVP18_001841 [Porospora cf. gigantea A]